MSKPRLTSLDKIMQSQGLGSRKACQLLIQQGRVRVNGELCQNPKQSFSPPGLQLTLDDEAWLVRDQVYVLLHKPANYECSRTPQAHPSVLSLLPPPLRERGVQPVGRLDQDTTGLLLLTDDGAWNHRICAPKHHVPKRYRVHGHAVFTAEMQQALAAGVCLHGEDLPYAASELCLLADKVLEFTIHQGIYHQVKRMVAAVGNHCLALERVGIGALNLGDLAPGQWRYLEAAEAQALVAAPTTKPSEDKPK